MFYFAKLIFSENTVTISEQMTEGVSPSEQCLMEEILQTQVTGVWVCAEMSFAN